MNFDRLLVKAKRVDNGEWVTGYLIKGENTYIMTPKQIYPMVVTYPNKFGESYISSSVWWVDEDTICQCTGLKDKDGVLIFEGDVITAKVNPRYVDRISWEGEPDVTGEVIYDFSGFRTRVENEKNRRYADFYDFLDNIEGGWQMHDMNYEHVKVIGNIHDSKGE